MFKLVYRNDLLTKLFLGLIAFVFVVGTAIMFGPGSWNFGFGNFVAKVGDIVITPKEYKLQLIRLQQIAGNKLPENRLELLALNMLITQAVFAYLSEKDGFFVSTQEVKDYIEKMFSVNGTFSPSLLRRYLNETHLTPKELEEMIRKQLLSDRYKKAVFFTSYANDEVLRLNLLPLTLMVKVEMFNLTPEDIENRIRIDNKFLKEFYNRTAKNWVEIKPERVAIYEVNGTDRVKSVYEKLKLGNNVNLKPVKIISANSTKGLKGKYETIFEEALRNKNIAVTQLKGNHYLIAVYKPKERKILSFNDIKNNPAFIKAAKRFKALEYIYSHRDKLQEEILSGKLNLKPIKRELSGFELMNKFGLGYTDLFALLKGKKTFTVVNNEGLIVIKIVDYYQKELDPRLVELLKQQIRKVDYTKRLQYLFEYDIKTGVVKPKINRNFFPSMAK